MKPLRYQRLDRLTQQFIAVVPEPFFDLIIDHRDFSLVINHHHSIWRMLNHLTELRFSPLAFGNIDDARQHESAFISEYGIKANLNRNFAAILTTPVELSPDAHCARRWMCKETSAEIRMRCAVSLRHQYLHPLAE